MPAPQVGEPFPGITLQTVKYREVRVPEDFRGKNLVLAWFPLAFSPTCTEQFEGFVQVHTQMERLHATVVGASCDSWYANEAWKAALGAPFPILSDWKRTASHAAGVFDEARQRPFRHIHLIDRAGVLRWERRYGGDECPRLEDFLDPLEEMA